MAHMFRDFLLMIRTRIIFSFNRTLRVCVLMFWFGCVFLLRCYGRNQYGAIWCDVGGIFPLEYLWNASRMTAWFWYFFCFFLFCAAIQLYSFCWRNSTIAVERMNFTHHILICHKYPNNNLSYKSRINAENRLTDRIKRTGWNHISRKIRPPEHVIFLIYINIHKNGKQ